jgi:hypothetical protein
VEIGWPSPLAAQTTQVLESQTFTAAAAIRGESKVRLGLGVWAG